ncbi:hypothetical protein ACTXT7_010497 [Hymenolepis weldensis]
MHVTFNIIDLNEEDEAINQIDKPEQHKTYTIGEAVEAYGLGRFQFSLTAANAMEMLLLSVLGPTLRCAWHLDSSQVALITTVVFLGFFFGAPVWGLFSDKFGRKRCFLVVLLWVSYTGLATSLSPNFIWFIILRGLVGFGMAGEGRHWWHSGQRVRQLSLNLQIDAHGFASGNADMRFAFHKQAQILLIKDKNLHLELDSLKKLGGDSALVLIAIELFVSITYTLMSEFLPVKYRAKVLIGISIFWAIGSTLEIGLAFMVLPKLGWRWLVFFSAIPLVIFCFLIPLLPESVHYLMTANRKKEAEQVIKKMAALNGRVPLEGELVYSTSATSEVELGKLSHLWAPGFRILSAMQPLLWFGAAFSYYGIILISSTLFNVRGACYKELVQHPDYNGFSLNKTAVVDQSCCAAFSKDDYLSMLISSLGEFTVEAKGGKVIRKKTYEPAEDFNNGLFGRRNTI